MMCLAFLLASHVNLDDLARSIAKNKQITTGLISSVMLLLASIFGTVLLLILSDKDPHELLIYS